MNSPNNPLIEVGPPLLKKSSKKNDLQDQGVAKGKNALIEKLITTLKTDERPYVLRVESQEDFCDIDSILLGLKLNPNLFSDFPGFNTWKANPLFGVDPGNIDLLLKQHAFSIPHWLREEIDVSMRVMDIKPATATDTVFQPAIAIGFRNFAAHLALLALLKDHHTRREAIIYPDDSVQIVINSEINRTLVPVFISRVKQSDSSNKRQMASLRHAASEGKKILLIIPGSLEEFQQFLPNGPVVALGQRVGNKHLLTLDMPIQETNELQAKKVDFKSWNLAMAA